MAPYGRNELWIQNPDGTPSRIERASIGVEDIWGRGRIPIFLDLNHDRRPDLVREQRRRPSGRAPDAEPDVRRPAGSVPTGPFWRHGGDRGRCAAAADWPTGTGGADLFVCGDDRIHLFRREPSGFRDVTQIVGLAMIAATAAPFGDSMAWQA